MTNKKVTTTMIISKIILFFLMIFFLHKENLIYAMNDEMSSIAEGLISDYSDDADIIIRNTKELSDTEYLIELSNKENEFGYIKLKNTNGSYIPIEFVIEENIEYSSTTYSSAGEFITSSVLSGLKYSSYNRLSSICCLRETFIESLTGKYACAVVALTEIAKQNHILLNNSILDTFEALWTYTNTSDSYYNNGIIYGSTLDSMLSKGMLAYARLVGCSIDTTIKSNPSYSFFKRAIDSGNSSTLSYRVNVTSGTTTKKVGHTVNVIGWYIYKDSSNNQYKYLAIADGWTGTQKYILYDQIDFVNTYGVEYIFY